MSLLKNKLREAGLTKTALAKMCGVRPSTASSWGDNPPQYAWTILDLAIKCKDHPSEYEVTVTLRPKDAKQD